MSSDDSYNPSSCDSDLDSQSDSNVEEEFVSVISKTDESPPLDICKACLTRGVFGNRPRDTFDPKSSSFCFCNLDGKFITHEFIKWSTEMEIYLKRSNEDTPRYKDIIAGMKTPKEICTKLVENESIYNCIVEQLSQVRKMSRTMKMWLNIGTVNGVLIDRLFKSSTKQIHLESFDLKRWSTIKYVNPWNFTEFNGVKVPEIRSSSFNVATIIDFVHRTPNLRELLVEIRRILKDTGFLIIHFNDCVSWERSYALDYKHKAMRDILDVDLQINNHYKLTSIKELVEEVGFEFLDSTILGPYGPYRDTFVICKTTISKPSK